MTKDKWSTLSMKDRAELISLGVQNGVTNIADIKETYNKYATGGPLKDSYNDPEEYYDYVTAKEVGEDIMYDEESKHWMSRDPRTGLVLKNPEHPTFNKSINVDKEQGYNLYKDILSGRYYTLQDSDLVLHPRRLFLKPHKYKSTEEDEERAYMMNHVSTWANRKDFSDIVPGYTREIIEERRAPYVSTILEAAKKHNINPEIIDALATLESRHDDNAISPVGAVGRMQLMPVNYKDIDPKDGHQNIKRGTEVLDYFRRRNKGDIRKAIAGYNGVKDAKKKVEDEINAKKRNGRYSDNYYEGLYNLIDSLEKYSAVDYPYKRKNQ